MNWLDEVKWDANGLGAGDRPGSKARNDVLMFALDEPRGARRQTAELGRGCISGALARQALVQGRGIGPRADGARDPPRLRQRRGAAARSPSWATSPASPATPAATQLLLPEIRGEERPVATVTEPVLERPVSRSTENMSGSPVKPAWPTPSRAWPPGHRKPPARQWRRSREELRRRRLLHKGPDAFLQEDRRGSHRGGDGGQGRRHGG